jgi:adenine-specific DNA-methyltransferase
MLRSVGIETVNLYSAFMSLAIMLIEKGGYLVAIIPRSFCNGPYYRPFRELIMTRTAIKQIHLFDSRSKAFKDDHVLQESIIICLEVGGKQGKVKISTSTDDTFSNLKINDYSYNQIVMQDDRESIIHIPTSAEADQINESKNVKYCLEEIGLEVSTGPVVDFRMKEHLISLPEENSVPLIYPIHFNGYSFEWPIENAKKPNAIKNNERTLKWLYPNGFYTVVRRFSSKEEKSRIIARVINPEKIAEYNWIGIENHLNVFHRRKKPLDPLLANGIAVYLNSSAIDNHFRRFSGHTQVNATDLRFIKYPSRDLLIELGRWVIRQGQLTQEKIDTQVEKVIL